VQGIFIALLPAGVSALSPLPDIRGGAVDRNPIIPSEYRGRWCLKSSTQYSDDKDLAEIRITAHKLHIYGADEHARRVSRRPDGALIVQFQDEAEGTLFDAERQFTRSPDGRELTLRSEDEDDSRLFRRCGD
jgi:hypothetical protein